MRDKGEAGARIVAYLDPGVLIDVAECSGRWCRAAVEGVKGWIEQGRIWGVYPDETFR
jgi:SH3-like domain-containing protein